MDFLAVDSENFNLSSIVSKVYNSRKQSARVQVEEPINAALRKTLGDFFDPYNQQLRGLFQIDVSDWR